MRTIELCALLLLASLTLTACESSTEVEQPELKTGANARLAIELPLDFPPDPRNAQIITEWSVIEAGAIWFRNASDTPIDLEMWTEDGDPGVQNRVGIFRLPAFETEAMALDEKYTTNEYRYDYWTLRFRQAYQVEVIYVGFAP